jgi:hypothetical protein
VQKVQLTVLWRHLRLSLPRTAEWMSAWQLAGVLLAVQWLAVQWLAVQWLAVQWLASATPPILARQLGCPQLAGDPLAKEKNPRPPRESEMNHGKPDIAPSCPPDDP